MERAFKVGEWVTVTGVIESLDGSLFRIRSSSGGSNWMFPNDLHNLEPEFVPREMLTWQMYEQHATVELVIGIIENHYIVKSGDDIYARKNAKEIHQELENGKVFKHKYGAIVYKTEDRSGFGFDYNKKYVNENSWSFKSFPENWQQYPPEDFEQLLIAEAEKRGFKSNIWIDRRPLKNFKHADNAIVKVRNKDFSFQNGFDGLQIFIDSKEIFNNGTWAKIID